MPITPCFERSDEALVTSEWPIGVYQMITISPDEAASPEALEGLMRDYLTYTGSKLLDHQIEQANRTHVHFVVSKGTLHNNVQSARFIHKKCGRANVKHSVCCDILEDRNPEGFLKYIAKTRTAAK